MANTLVRVIAVAFSDTDKSGGFSTAYFWDLSTARRTRAELRAKGRHAVLSVEYLPAHLAAGLVNGPRPCAEHDWKLKEGGIAYCGRCGHTPAGQEGY